MNPICIYTWDIVNVIIFKYLRSNPQNTNRFFSKIPPHIKQTPTHHFSTTFPVISLNISGNASGHTRSDYRAKKEGEEEERRRH